MPVEQTIRERVIALLEARPELTDAAFGEQIGRGYSWVSAFRTGVRNANDLPLLMAIARVFGVTVGYLIGEKPAAADPMLAEVTERWTDLSDQSKAAVVATVRAFDPSDDDDLPPTTPPSGRGPRDDGTPNTGGMPPRRPAPPKKK